MKQHYKALYGRISKKGSAQYNAAGTHGNT